MRESMPWLLQLLCGTYYGMIVLGAVQLFFFFFQRWWLWGETKKCSAVLVVVRGVLKRSRFESSIHINRTNIYIHGLYRALHICFFFVKYISGIELYMYIKYTYIIFFIAEKTEGGMWTGEEFFFSDSLRGWRRLWGCVQEGGKNENRERGASM